MFDPAREVLCPNGHRNQRGMRFCGQCAAPLEEAGAAPVTPSFSSPPAFAPPAAPPTPLAPPIPFPSTAAPTRSRRRPLILGFGVVILVAVLAVGAFAVLGKSGPLVPHHTLRGMFALITSSGVKGSWNECSGSGGYDDIDAGMPVTVKDADGKIIGATTTQHLTSALLPTLVQMDKDAGLGWHLTGATDAERQADLTSKLGLYAPISCNLYFEVDVTESAFYAVTVGTRGTITYSLDQMKAANFSVGTQVGN